MFVFMAEYTPMYLVVGIHIYSEAGSILTHCPQSQWHKKWTPQSKQTSVERCLGRMIAEAKEK